MTKKSIIVIIDDDDALRSSLMRMLAGGLYEVRSFDSASHFLERRDFAGVSCVVSDLCMPEVDGLELLRTLKEKCPWISLVLITAFGDVPASVSAIKGGAEDFLEKPVKRATLLAAINRGVECSLSSKEAATELNCWKARYQQLTPREVQVFALVTAGLLNKQVAAELGTSVRTIKQHRSKVMLKMEAESAAELTIMADRLGMRPRGVDFSTAKGRRHAA